MPQKKPSLDAMMADDLDSYSNSLQAMGNDDGYSLFPKSDYQHDGEPIPYSQRSTAISFLVVHPSSFVCTAHFCTQWMESSETR
jgi:hypothetical protein